MVVLGRFNRAMEGHLLALKEPGYSGAQTVPSCRGLSDKSSLLPAAQARRLLFPLAVIHL